MAHHRGSLLALCYKNNRVLSLGCEYSLKLHVKNQPVPKHMLIAGEKNRLLSISIGERYVSSLHERHGGIKVFEGNSIVG